MVRISYVARQALKTSGYKPSYPGERLRSVATKNAAQVGFLTSLDFLSWVASNPNGVISLPTGRTPQYFIEYTKQILEGLRHEQAYFQAILGRYNIDPDHVLENMPTLHFVQMDDFWPMPADHDKRFYSYVREHYIEGFGLDESRALLLDTSEIGLPEGKSWEEVFTNGKVDLSVILKNDRSLSPEKLLQKQAILEARRFCEKREEEIRALGGIGYFLGGLGPDSHIVFNIYGSPRNSRTRLDVLNEASCAAAATDLGGVEQARNKAVITLGMGTLCINPEVRIRIFACGPDKADPLSQAIASDDLLVPAREFDGLSDVLFFVTESATSWLSIERQVTSISTDSTTIAEREIDQVVSQLSLAAGKPISALRRVDFDSDPVARALLKRLAVTDPPLAEVMDRMQRKFALALPQGETITHTEPHPDDIVLGLLPLVIKFLASGNETHAISMTNGNKAVTNAFVLLELVNLDAQLQSQRERVQALAAQPTEQLRLYNQGDLELSRAARLYQILQALYSEVTHQTLRDLRLYCLEHPPGKKDSPEVIVLKGLLREFESETFLTSLGISADNIRHLGLNLSPGVFTVYPSPADIQNLTDTLSATQATWLTVADDVEGAGPAAHFLTLQGIAAALQTSSSVQSVIGYNNVWSRPGIWESHFALPVAASELDLIRTLFLTHYRSQVTAAFPSPQYLGPFSDMAVGNLRLNLDDARIMLGDHLPPEIASDAQGILLLRKFSPTRLTALADQLREEAQGNIEKLAGAFL